MKKMNSEDVKSSRVSIFKKFGKIDKEVLRKEVKSLVITLVAIGLILLLVVGYVGLRYQKISKMTFEEMLVFAAKSKNTKITVGIVQDGKMSYKVYGKNKEELPQIEHVYEIASITKTFTAALLFKAIEEGKVSLDDHIDKYLDLPTRDYYPTLKRLVTHTSGYLTEYAGESKARVLENIGSFGLKDKDYDFNYSNFGFAVIGLVLEEIYGQDYTSLVNAYVKDELGMLNTKVSDGSGDLGKYIVEPASSGQKPVGSLISTVTDMMTYAKIQLSGEPNYLAQMQVPITKVNAGGRESKELNTKIGAIGGAWLIDTDNNITWHDGTMGSYTSYIGFDKERQIAVVVLINASADILIPTSLYSSMIGARLLIDLQSQN